MNYLNKMIDLVKANKKLDKNIVMNIVNDPSIPKKGVIGDNCSYTIKEYIDEIDNTSFAVKELVIFNKSITNFYSINTGEVSKS